MHPALLGLARAYLAVQAAGSAVEGVVRDGRTGAPLVGASVAAPEFGRATVTGEGGHYRLGGLAAGPRHLVVRHVGYAPHTLHALVPHTGTVTIDVLLRADPHRLQRVVVRPRVAVRGAQPDPGRAAGALSATAAEIREHPMLAEPDAFLALAGGEVTVMPESPAGVHVRGGAADQTSFLLDGTPVLSPYHTTGTFAAWNPDALEQVTLDADDAPLARAGALAGVVSATTRRPGRETSWRGTSSTAQARLTVDGPLGATDAGFLVALRSTFAGTVRRSREASYVAGVAGDALATFETPLAGGTARALYFTSLNDLDAAAAREPADPRRNEFEWSSRSLGAEWTRGVAHGRISLRAWQATADAGARWLPTDEPDLTLASSRADQGALALVEIGGGDHARALTRVGVRVTNVRTRYAVREPGEARPRLAREASLPDATLLGSHRRRVARGLDAEGGVALTTARGVAYAAPSARLAWLARPALTLAAGYERTHQRWQSLRNPESIAGVLFPADLHVGADADGVPVARSDQGTLTAELRPWAGTRLRAHAYARAFDGVLLVAPRTAHPFATDDWSTGAGTSTGLVLDVASAGARHGVFASSAWQQVRLRKGGAGFSPAWVPRFSAELAGVVHARPTLALRAGIAHARGRRGSPMLGALEWEPCNISERGCEFGGSPAADPSRPGGARLPSYTRLDVGARKHWHLRMGSRHAMVGAFGSATNLLGRRNVLAARASSAGARSTIGLRPRSPLVFGVDWLF